VLHYSENIWCQYRYTCQVGVSSSQDYASLNQMIWENKIRGKARECPIISKTAFSLKNSNKLKPIMCVTLCGESATTSDINPSFSAGFLGATFCREQKGMP